MKRRSHLLAAASLVAGLATTAQAEELGTGLSLSSNVAITSNYIFRGISESSEDPAVQGGLDVEHESGVYAGTWASSLLYEAGYSDQPALELDAFGGYETPLTDSLWVDIGVTQFGYPNATDLNTTEPYLGIGTSLGGVEGDLYVHGSADYFDASDEDVSAVYTATNWSVPLGAGFYGSAHAGYLSSDSETDLDASLGVGYTYGTLDVSLAGSYYDPDSGDEDEQVAFTIARAF